MVPSSASQSSSSRITAGPPPSSSSNALTSLLEPNVPIAPTRPRYKAKGKQRWQESFDSASSSSPSYTSSPAATFLDSSPASSSGPRNRLLDSSSSKTPDSVSRGKAPEGIPPPTSLSDTNSCRLSPLGYNMASHQKYESVDLNARYADPDVPPRLVCYTKHGQASLFR